MDNISLYKLSRLQRLSKLVELNIIDEHDVSLLKSSSSEKLCKIADNFIENTIGCLPMPLGIVNNCLINNNFITVPLAVEETSIIAGLNKTAKCFAKCGGVKAYQEGSLSIGQIYIESIKDIKVAQTIIAKNKECLLKFLNINVLSSLCSRGGGAHDIEPRILKNNAIVLHVYIDTCDAMGANIINMALENLKPRIEELLNVRVDACILSNLNDKKITKAKVEITDISLNLMQQIVKISNFAKMDPYRAATNNKGIMNAIDAIAIATGNDWRAIAAGAHAYAASAGQYASLSDWVIKDNKLIGMLSMPITVGTVGGVTKNHPLAKFSLKLLKVKSSEDLACKMAAAGLMQNFAALKALASDGIVAGHMRLHIKNLIMATDANKDERLQLQNKLELQLKTNKKVSCTDAEKCLNELRS